MIINESIYQKQKERIRLFENVDRTASLENFQFLTVFTDLLILNIILILSLSVSLASTTINARISIWVTSFIAVANLIWLIIALYNDIYRWYEVVRPVKKVKTLLYIFSLYFAILTSVYYYLFFSVLQINFLVPFIIGFLGLSMMSHLFFRKFYKDRMPAFQYVVVGGKNNHLKYIEEIFEVSYGGKSKCIGLFGNDPSEVSNWLGRYADLKHFIKHNSFNKLFYINSDLTRLEVKNIIELCESRFIDFEIIPIEIDIFKGATTVVLEDKLAIVSPKKEPLQRLRNKLIKRTFDIFFSLLVIITIVPWLFPIIAFLIKMESKGSIFFLQKRTGYWNRSFNFIKFRSMTVNKEANKKQAVRNDLRVTKIGAFLRKSSLDELPQFFNVLKGDMSVVGPRPHMIKHTEEYSELIETYMVRHKVKPGITGWAQINGYRGPTETLDKMQKRVKYDVHYMKNWTILMDIRCVIFTVINMIRGEENAC